MRNPNIPSSPDSQPRLSGREAVILAMGATAFAIELGPNGHVPEVLPAASDQPPVDAIVPAAE